MSITNGNGAMTIVEDRDSVLGPPIQRHDMTTATAIQLAAAMIDKRIATARQWPRSIARFKKQASELIREDVELARSAEYAKPVGGGVVRGPSIRLVEIAALCWGNIDVGIVDRTIDDKSVSVTAYAYDLEGNYREEGYASTSIIGKNGQRYPQHLIETTVMATASKARRNAIEKIIPKAFIKDLANLAKEVAAGNKEPLDVTRQKTLDFFARTYKVQPGQIFALLGIDGADDINDERLDELRAIATSLKDGESKVSDWFAEETESKTAAIKAKLDERKNGVKPAAKTEAAPVDTKPPEPTKPAAAVDDKLAGLLKTFDARGGDLVKWLDENGYDSLQTLLETKNKARSEACSALNAAIQALAGEGAK